MADADAADPSSNGLLYYYYVPAGGYAPNGNILFRSDMVMGDWYYNYDAVDRLVSATPDTTAPTKYQYNFGCWTYDAYGNRTSESFSMTACGNSPPLASWANYNPANNQVTTASTGGYIYDASGNTLFDGLNYYWYDAEGQLCAEQSYRLKVWGTTYQYIYDAEGARIGKGTLATAPPIGATCAPPQASGSTLSFGASSVFNTRWLVDLGGQQVTELTETPTTETWAHSNIFLGGALAATYDYNNGKGGLHYSLSDPLGTRRVQVSVLGLVEENCTSLPFGNDINNPATADCTIPTGAPSTADDATEHHFTQKERDTESGNDYFFARYYTSAMGRFTTPDWSAKVTPVPYAALTDPQSLNLYAYVRNNPLKTNDPDGHDGDPCKGQSNCTYNKDNHIATVTTTTTTKTRTVNKDANGNVTGVTDTKTTSTITAKLLVGSNNAVTPLEGSMTSTTSSTTYSNGKVVGESSSGPMTKPLSALDVAQQDPGAISQVQQSLQPTGIDRIIAQPVTFGGLAGAAAGGAIGLACGPGAPVCSTVGAVVGLAGTGAAIYGFLNGK
jgi:RHS repeat-associated protein